MSTTHSRSARAAVALLLLLPLAVPVASADTGGATNDQWIRQTGIGGDNEAGEDVAVGPDGAVYVVGGTGTTYTDEPRFGDAFVAKWTPDGSQVWRRRFGTAMEDRAKAVAVDDDGGVYVVGETSGDLGATLDGASDPFVRKYTAAGELEWSEQFSGANTETGLLEGASDAVFANGILHVVGSRSNQAFVRRYAPDGTVLGTQSFFRGTGPSGAPSATYANAIAVHGADTFVGGGTWDAQEGMAFLVRLGPAGERTVWLDGAWDGPAGIGVSADGVYVAHMVFDEADDWSGRTRLTRFSHDLVQQWQRTDGPSPFEWPLRLTVDGAGRPYVVGWQETGPDSDCGCVDAFVRKYAADGTVLWDVRFGTESYDAAHGVAAAGDRLYVTGQLCGFVEGGGPGNAFLASFPIERTVPVDRIAGTDRIETAIAVSQASFPDAGASAAVVVSAQHAVDAFVAGPLAAANSGTILMTGSTVDPRVRDELLRVLAEGAPILVVGGDQAVTSAAFAQLEALGHPITRVAGSDRFATAVEVASTMSAERTILADGTSAADAADAAVAAAAAAHLRVPLLLTAGPSLPDATAAFLAQSSGHRLVVGGPAAAAVPGAAAYVGADRAETAALVAELHGRPRSVTLVSDRAPSDAMMASVLAARRGAPLLYAGTAELPTSTMDRLTLDLAEVTVLGGTGVVSADLVTSISALLVER